MLLFAPPIVLRQISAILLFTPPPIPRGFTIMKCFWPLIFLHTARIIRTLATTSPEIAGAQNGYALDGSTLTFKAPLNDSNSRLTRNGQPYCERTWQFNLLLNCQSYYVPVLVAARLLTPLGNPPPNSMIFFAALQLLEQVKDRTWLAKVLNALNQHWQKNNANKNKLQPNGQATATADGRIG
jgi:hypothetical protein